MFERRASLLATAALIAGTVTPLSAVASAQEASGPVFINEFHYDNDGTDAGEFVEIAGPAGTDLSGYEVVLYNGNGNTVYRTDLIAVDVVLEDESGGYGFHVIEYPSNGIQNGSPDGIALTDGTDLIQFLSYEGTLTGSGGPADGVLSTDIGVEQTDDADLDPVGASLQLTGDGPTYTDFTWQRTQVNTSGEVNAGQTFGGDGGGDPDPDPPANGTIFVSEFHYDNAGTDTGEFVEVTAPAGTDLTGYEIVLYNGSNNAVYSTRTLSGTVDGDIEGYGTLVAEYPSNGIQNGSPDGIALTDAGGDVVEFISYEGTMTAADGPALGETSRDVGTSQDGSEPVGASIERVGDVPTDFEWVSDEENSKGEPNPGSTIDGTFIPIPDPRPVAQCTDVTTTVGVAASAPQRASDATGTVTGVEITAGTTDGIELQNIVAASEDGGDLTADLVVDDTVGAGEYPVTLTFTNDDAEPQTTDCTLVVDVEPDYCQTPTLISDINVVGGDGLPDTPLIDERVGVEAIVTADFMDGLNGFYVQEEEADYDDDETTSEGVFVYAPAEDSAPEVGTLVCITGTIDMFSGAVQLTNVTIEEIAPGQALPSAVELELPVDDTTEIAQIAGMLTELTGEDGTLVVTQNYFQGQYGELDLSATERLWNPTELYDPDSTEAAELREANLNNYIKLDDADSEQNPDPLPWYDNGATRAGAETDDTIDGVASFQFGAFRIQPTNPDDIQFINEDNPRPDGAPDVTGGAGEDESAISVATFNVLNYFLTLDEGTNDVCGASADMECRGADTQAEFDLQRAKILTALTELDGDVVGLMEMENTPGVEPLEDLVGALNAALGEGTYAYIDTGVVGTDAIRNGFIYQPDAVTPVGDFAILDSSVDPAFDDDRNRPVIAQAFEENVSGEVFVVAVNHLKSKGSSCGEGDDHPLAGSCDATRTQAADAMVRWLATDPTDSGSDQVAIIGDLNSYAAEDPITVIEEAGYVDAFEDQTGEVYSYVFDGEHGRLDHILLSEELDEHLIAAEAWHTNVDEPSALDYNDYNLGAYQDTSEFRASDHDALVVGLAFGSSTEEPPVDGPATKDDCKAGGWRDLGYRNQGRCVADIASDGRSADASERRSAGPGDGAVRGRSIPRGFR